MTTQVGAFSTHAEHWHQIDWERCYRTVSRLQARIVKATQMDSNPEVARSMRRKSGVQRLERSAGKLARCVLRGGGGGNIAFLPDHSALGNANCLERGLAGGAPSFLARRLRSACGSRRSP